MAEEEEEEEEKVVPQPVGSTPGLRLCRLTSSVASAAATIVQSHAPSRDQARPQPTYDLSS
jgi:hypothetical protein